MQQSNGQPTTGGSAEYARILAALAKQDVNAIGDALRHILKRLGRPDDEDALNADAKAFDRDHRI